VNAPGVGCGAAIVRDGRLLLVKRRRAPEAGHWSLPGGKVDFGESVADAVKREIREEVGLEIELLRPLGVAETIGVDDQHWVSPIYLAYAAEGEARNNEPEKLEAVAWVALEAPPQPLALAAQQALEALRTI
jgi:ADP-ribose pyrophosphatase YjhB (NUDIX family)